ncbi:hypothetical protein OSC52_15220 [Clostridium pasteurianum]|uniref:hypothetical protein n=1 Tax=Clostridium pasteurianum TaxID=1501 RepID=UPI002260BA6E|nr:hypothetical protein [Clostridium pasteurianum]UZW13187.1 hypothetical protein OSC52_15220 [Clostridium pasteurianum]
MSLVLVAGNKNYILFMGEGRVTNQEGKEVESNYRKIIKLKENCIIGFAGDRNCCEAIIKPLTDGSINVNNLSFYEISEVVQSRANKIIENINLGVWRKANYYFALGCKEYGNLKLNAYFTDDGLGGVKCISQYNYTLNDLAPKLITLSSGVYDHYAYCQKLYSRNPEPDINNMYKILKNTIIDGSEHDNTINTNVYSEKILI